MSKAHSELYTNTIQDLMRMVAWLRSLPNPGKAPCADSALYFAPKERRFYLGQHYQPTDTKPRTIRDGTYAPIANLSGLPPRRIARFIKLQRRPLALLAVKEAAGDTSGVDHLKHLIALRAIGHRKRHKVPSGSRSTP